MVNVRVIRESVLQRVEKEMVLLVLLLVRLILHGSELVTMDSVPVFKEIVLQETHRWRDGPGLLNGTPRTTHGRQSVKIMCVSVLREHVLLKLCNIGGYKSQLFDL